MVGAPATLRRGCWLKNDAGGAFGQVAVHTAAGVRTLRATPRSRTLVPSWWEISFGKPLIRCTAHVG
jgi:hypothetical protein